MADKSVRNAVVKSLNDSFRAFDTDKSLHIEPHEFILLMNKLTNSLNVEDASKEEILEIFKELDENGDEKISQAEFMKLVEEVANIIEEEERKHPSWWFAWSICFTFPSNRTMLWIYFQTTLYNNINQWVKRLCKLLANMLVKL